MEEGNTLSQTLLPYLNKITDYSFLQSTDSFICSRFLSSLIRHLIDTKGGVDIGFMLFAMRVDPSKLIAIIEYEGNRQTLIKTCIHLNFNQEAAQLIAELPSKFLWPDLLKFFKDKDSGRTS